MDSYYLGVEYSHPLFGHFEGFRKNDVIVVGSQEVLSHAHGMRGFVNPQSTGISTVISLQFPPHHMHVNAVLGHVISIQRV
jgi:hypothetical protein